MVIKGPGAKLAAIICHGGFGCREQTRPNLGGPPIVAGWQTIELQRKQLIDFVSKAWHDNKDQSFDGPGNSIESNRLYVMRRL